MQRMIALHHGTSFPCPLTYSGADYAFSSVQATARFGTLELIKLHGSITWFYSGEDAFHSEQVIVSPSEARIRWDPPPKIPPPLPQSTSGMVPLIAPPIADKTPHFRNKVISSMWRRAAMSLERAGRVYCLGYSLPQTDLTVRFLLSAAVRGKTPTEFYVVNTDEKSLRHYETLLPNGYKFKGDFAGPENGIRPFVGWLIDSDPDTLLAETAGVDGRFRSRPATAQRL